MPRRALEVRGIVQGVGFRPYVHGLAVRLGLRGFVQNRTGSVLIEIEGSEAALNQFHVELVSAAPPRARIETVRSSSRVSTGEGDFRIRESAAGDGCAVVPADAAVCSACLRELFDPRDRRHRYPFINCMHCGPRLTIVTGSPYDRDRTTMASFPLCAECQAEYSNPNNRRYHAQPIACPACGPRLTLRGRSGEPFDAPDALSRFALCLQRGQIGALKGLGGYHLVCDARCERTVSELRRRKHRDEKPFAIMVRDLAAVLRLCEAKPLERDLLGSPQAPIVLLRRCSAAQEAVASSVAPGNPYLGMMLPYTPLHHLLMEAVGTVPLVVTSGNRSDEPIAYEDDRAIESLSGIADVFLTHDRPIQVRCEDSVVRVDETRVVPLRRSRGYAPEPMTLPMTSSQPVLAVGGQLKGTFALASGNQAFVSHHLGDLDDYDAWRAFTRDIQLYEELLSISPGVIAHDLHFDYASTRYAEARGLPLIAVQHHHAHMASAMVEHGLQERVIGVTFDGAGLGSDGAIWGGEFLVGDLAGFRRAAHLRYVGMPGGERSAREPWRMAVSHLLDGGCDLARFPFLHDDASIRNVRHQLTHGEHVPLTSSVGRLFDAVAALSGLRNVVSHEGQAAMEFEWCAAGRCHPDPYPWALEEGIVDTRPLIRAVADDVLRSVPARIVARRFHTTLAEIIGGVCCRIRDVEGLSRVVLSGGVFQNALLTQEARARLSREGFQVYCHERVPANDGGLSLGQLAVAVQQLSPRPGHRE